MCGCWGQNRSSFTRKPASKTQVGASSYRPIAPEDTVALASVPQSERGLDFLDGAADIWMQRTHVHDQCAATSSFIIANIYPALLGLGLG